MRYTSVPSPSPEPEAAQKRSVTGQTERELTRFVRPATLVDWFLIHL